MSEIMGMLWFPVDMPLPAELDRQSALAVQSQPARSTATAVRASGSGSGLSGPGWMKARRRRSAQAHSSSTSLSANSSSTTIAIPPPRLSLDTTSIFNPPTLPPLPSPPSMAAAAAVPSVASSNGTAPDDLNLRNYSPKSPVEYRVPDNAVISSSSSAARRKASNAAPSSSSSLAASSAPPITAGQTLSSPPATDEPDTSRRRAESKSSGVSSAASTTPAPTPLSASGSGSGHSIFSKGASSGKPSLVFKNGRKHHGYDSHKAPYPVSYDHVVLDLDQWDHAFFKSLKGSSSFVDFERDDPPENCLDIGCGSGGWILDAALEWPNCKFTGFDLVPIQPPLSLLEKTLNIGNRISWVHGNFNTGKLPFENDTFDYIHVRSIAKGVPETCWDKFFDDVHRILTPGGVLEMIEEDILFPLITPPWDPLLHMPSDEDAEFEGTLSIGSGENETSTVLSSTTSVTASSSGTGTTGSSTGSTLTNGKAEPVDLNPSTHPHRFIEWLYFKMYSTRWINTSPTSLLPRFFNVYFQHVSCPAPVNFPLPPTPSQDPNKPLGVGAIPSLSPITPTSATAASRPRPGGKAWSEDRSALPSPSPSFSASLSPSSPASTGGISSILSLGGSGGSENSTRPSTAVSVLSGTGTAAGNRARSKSTSFISHTPGSSIVSVLDGTFPPSLSTGASSLSAAAVAAATRPFLNTNAVMIQTPADAAIFPIGKLDERSLHMHLYRTYQSVMAVREEMWECLEHQRKLASADAGAEAKKELEEAGWEEEVPDSTTASARDKFDGMMERYAKQMDERCGLSQMLTSVLGWEPPFRDPPTQKELAALEEQREHVEKHRNLLSPPPFRESEASRVIRVLLGYKG